MIFCWFNIVFFYVLFVINPTLICTHSYRSTNENRKCSHPTIKEETRQSTFSLAQDKVVPFPRNKKSPMVVSSGNLTNRSTPMPPPRRTSSQQRFVSFLFCFVCFFFVFSVLTMFRKLDFLFGTTTRKMCWILANAWVFG